MQVCLGALNNVLYFFMVKFASFSKYYHVGMQKPVFVVMLACECKDRNFNLQYYAKVLIFRNILP